MANLAIKRHPRRGKEVIERLEMLGGINSHNLYGDESYIYYTIDSDKEIKGGFDVFGDEQLCHFTLEEFEEKFPYKVGDKVKNARIEDYIGRIISTQWDNNENQIIYTVEWDDATQSKLTYFVRGLQPYKEENYCQVIGNDTSSNGINTSISLKDEDINKTNETIFEWNTQTCDIMNNIIKENMKTSKIYEQVNRYLLENRVKNAQNLLDIEKCLENDDMKLPENITIHSKGIGSIDFIKWYKSKQYPTNLKECYDVLGVPNNERYVEVDNPIFPNKLIKSFTELLICRTAYWEIAGEKMSLGKAWEPDWLNAEQDKYVLFIHNNAICSNRYVLGHKILAFPTEEMRDVFYENFKELIKKTKELL